jgi:hypothetical protein
MRARVRALTCGARARRAFGMLRRANLRLPSLPYPLPSPPTAARHTQDKYQVISHRNISTSNSTKGEIRWKETCEQQMAQLEKDILKLSSNGPVYIVE